jgi:hypothetical protein
MGQHFTDTQLVSPAEASVSVRSDPEQWASAHALRCAEKETTAPGSTGFAVKMGRSFLILQGRYLWFKWLVLWQWDG